MIVAMLSMKNFIWFLIKFFPQKNAKNLYNMLEISKIQTKFEKKNKKNYCPKGKQIFVQTICTFLFVVKKLHYK